MNRSVELPQVRASLVLDLLPNKKVVLIFVEPIACVCILRTAKEAAIRSAWIQYLESAIGRTEEQKRGRIVLICEHLIPIFQSHRAGPVRGMTW
jgi:hypothetical protein